MQLLEQRLSLVAAPTPLCLLNNLSQEFGSDIYIKEDDNTGICLGGNKVRKLEYLIYEALEQEADCVITTGGLQSNHARLTTAVARKCGLEPELVLKDQGKEVNGNVRLNALMGANIHKVAQGNDVASEVAKVQTQLKDQGKRVYNIPLGGSNEVGVLGYIKAALELKQQLDVKGLEGANIVMATGSGGTLAGVIMANMIWDLNFNIVGISVMNPAQEMREVVNDLIQRTDQSYALNLNSEAEFEIYDEFIGPGYGIPDESTLDSIRYVAKCEGVILDPVYTGKAMTGLLGLKDHGQKLSSTSKKPVVFWHTGGAPAIFAYPEVLK